MSSISGFSNRLHSAKYYGMTRNQLNIMNFVHENCFCFARKIRQYENNQMESLFDSFNESYFGNTTKSEERDLSTDLPQIKGI